MNPGKKFLFNSGVAGVIQSCLAASLGVSVLILMIAALASSKTSFANMFPLWGFDKKAAVEAATVGSYTSVDPFAHSGTMGILSAVLATFAIAPWAFVGFDTIPQAAALENWPELIVNSEGTPWLLLAAAERLLGTFGKVLLVGIAVMSAVLTGIMGFYMASSRLMYSMSRDGYLPAFFKKIDSKHGMPKNAMFFCLVSLCQAQFSAAKRLVGLWISAIGASIGYGFTYLSTLKTMKKDGDSTKLLKTTAVIGLDFSIIFMILQLILIPGLASVHFGNESYLMLSVWIVLGFAFYLKQKKNFSEK